MTSNPAEDPGRLDEIWRSLLRLRPVTTDELGVKLRLDADSVQFVTDLLREGGRLLADGRTISYDQPITLVTRFVQEGLQESLARWGDTVRELSGVLAELPAMAHAWQLGEPDDHKLHFEVIQGPNAPRQAWYEFSPRGIQPSVTIVAPELGVDVVFEEDRVASAYEKLVASGGSLRVLISTEQAGDPRCREMIENLALGGTQVRHHPAPPSWFWVTDGGYVGLPGVWGEPWPDTVVLFSHPVMGDALRLLADRLWLEGEPINQEARHWDPLLRLVHAGSQVEAAARALGISVRTARRRIAEAMEHYGVANMFSLGAAWSQDHSARQR